MSNLGIIRIAMVAPVELIGLKYKSAQMSRQKSIIKHKPLSLKDIKTIQIARRNMAVVNRCKSLLVNRTRIQDLSA